MTLARVVVEIANLKPKKDGDEGERFDLVGVYEKIASGEHFAGTLLVATGKGDLWAAMLRAGAAALDCVNVERQCPLCLSMSDDEGGKAIKHGEFLGAECPLSEVK